MDNTGHFIEYKIVDKWKKLTDCWHLFETYRLCTSEDKKHIVIIWTRATTCGHLLYSVQESMTVSIYRRVLHKIVDMLYRYQFAGIYIRVKTKKSTRLWTPEKWVNRLWPSTSTRYQVEGIYRSSVPDCEHLSKLYLENQKLHDGLSRNREIVATQFKTKYM